jgi:pSer/pThr/pTyr-binding forkhead associated (FHA) protein
MEGGHPIALEGMQIGAGGGDAFGATAFAPPGQHPGGPPPMPPTSAMSGYGADQHQQQHPGPPPAPPPPAPQQAAGGQKAPGADNRRALAGFLVSFQDDPMGKFWPLYQGKNTIGRAETGQDVDVAIGHGTTSTHHASIECEGARFTLADLGSTNGTFHNEEAIGFQGRRDLRDGDKVRFGGYSTILFNVAGRS